MNKCLSFLSNATTIIEEYNIDTDGLPPQRHTLYAEGFDAGGTPVRDEMDVWVFTFEIKENLVTRYFNPLKPDSARVVYQILPQEYADPDVSPSPVTMEIEILDKDSILIYGPRYLTDDEMKNQTLYWDGKDNLGDTVDVCVMGSG